MSGQVILYFDDQADALRFALAAGSVMAGDSARVSDDLLQKTARISRIRLDAAKGKKADPEDFPSPLLALPILWQHDGPSLSAWVFMRCPHSTGPRLRPRALGTSGKSARPW